MLVGRHRERAQLDALLAGLAEHRSAALVIQGEPGIGKSALLSYAADRAGPARVLRAQGVETELELPFAALHQLLYPQRVDLDRLPAPQAAALRGALGLGPGQADDRFLVAAGVLTLLGELAGDDGLLCLVDDAHWLDRPSADALLFAARRLDAEGVGLIFATRSGEQHPFPAPGLTAVTLAGLDAVESDTLLAGRAPDTSAAVRQHLVASTAGNPLALLELPGILTAEQRTGRRPLPAPLPAGTQVTRLFTDRLRRLEPAGRRLLEVAAADDTGDLAVILRAAERVDAPASALHAAEQIGLVEIRDGRLGFRHPLMRSAVYHDATFAARQAAHLALADALDEHDQPDRRAWHRAAATVGADEEIAAALERSADRATQLGGAAAAAAALQRSAELTPASPDRARRLVAAAGAYWTAGSAPPALALLQQADPLVTAAPARAQVLHLRGLIELRSGLPEVAYRLLLDSATHAAATDPGTALRTLVLAAEAASFNGDAARVIEVGEVAANISAGADDGPAGLIAGMLSGTAAIFAGQWSTGAQQLRAVVTAAERLDDPAALLWAGRAALYLGDQHAARAMHERAVRAARAAGALGLLTTALDRIAFSDLLLGRPEDVEANAAEGLQLAGEIGQDEAVIHYRGILAHAAALRGDESACRANAEQSATGAAARNIRLVGALSMWALGLLELSLGRPEAALAQFDRLAPGSGTDHPAIRLWSTPDLVEAAARAGRPETARAQLDAFAAWSERTGIAWALASTARGRGLLADLPTALDEYERALSHLAADGSARLFDEARTNLLYGEALRRAKRRSQSRNHLRSALESFERLGATPWAERAGAELRASGETARSRRPDAQLQLTPQERQIAKYAGHGASNPEIAAALFLSRRTVEYHLRKVFTKLGIASRTELARLDLDTAS
jgi:DNA-binding CsgD family transcriptional regulator